MKNSSCPRKERFSVESSDMEIEEDEEEQPSVSTEATDGFDEYLKSIDEINLH